jgi:predicted Fe-Mo cluster-binding NifX family protein
MMMTTQFIAIGVDEKKQIWRGHFGIAPVYQLYDLSGNLVEERQNPYGAKLDGNQAHHNDPMKIVELLSDCSVFIAYRLGDASKQKLVQHFGIEALLTKEEVPQLAIKTYIKNNKQT